MSDDDEGHFALATVIDDSDKEHPRRGVASVRLGTPEETDPVIRWALDDGDLLRIYQAEMRRVGARKSVTVSSLMRHMV